LIASQNLFAARTRSALVVVRQAIRAHRSAIVDRHGIELEVQRVGQVDLDALGALRFDQLR